MITLRELCLENGDCHLDSVSLEVADGEIYFLLNRPGRGHDILFRVLGGFQRPSSGACLFDGRPRGAAGPFSAPALIDRVGDAADFDTEARVGDWIDFLCSGCGLDRERLFQTLLVCNFHERHLARRVRELPGEMFQQVYLAAALAPARGNIVINDFIRGSEKGFELKFNKLLLQQKAEGRAILSLGSDIFYASEIADRVGFIKNGRLLFEADASELKEMDIKGLYLKFLN